MHHTLKNPTSAGYADQHGSVRRAVQRRSTACTAAGVHPHHRLRAGAARSVAQPTQVPSSVALPLPGWWTVPEDSAADLALPRAVEAPPLYVGKHAVVCGAGPCGTLSAIFLARHGFSVDVFEKRPPPPAVTAAGSQMQVGPRSFCVMLHRRGMEALAAGGVVLPPDMCIRRGDVTRFRDSQLYRTEAPPWSHSVNRDLLTAFLISRAKDQHPGLIRYHFEQQLDKLSVGDKQAAFLDAATGQSVSYSYDLFIGADGANSRARAAFANQVEGFTFVQAPDDMEYKTLMLPPLGHKEPAPYYTLFDEERNVFFVCARDRVAGNQTRGVLVLSKGGFDALKSEHDYYQVLQQSFPEPFSEEQRWDMACQLVGAPLCHGSLNTRCSQLWGPSAVLMGDAAHSMWPTLGQGVNTALEDAVVFNTTLQDCRGDLSFVPRAFHNARHQDVLAVVDMTQHSYGAGRHAISTRDIFRSMLLTWLAKLLPRLLSAPALTLINETTMRYSLIKEQQEHEEQVMNAVASLVEVGGMATVVVVLGLAYTSLAFQ